MKFKSNSQTLSKSLKILSPIIDYNHSELFYRYIRIGYYDKSQIEFRAHNDFVVGSVLINGYDIEEDKNEPVYVLGKHLISLLNTIKGNIAIQFIVASNKCTLQFGSSEYVLPILDKEMVSSSIDLELQKEYDKVCSNFSSEVNFKIDAFQVGCNSISHCVSSDNAQWALQNIVIETEKSSLLACNAIAGAHIPLSLSVVNGLRKTKKHNIILHKKLCDCIGNVTETNDVHLNYDSEQKTIAGKFGNFRFLASVLEAYPYDQIISLVDQFYASDLEKDPLIHLSFDPNDLSYCLSRLLLFVDDNTSAIRFRYVDNVLLLESTGRVKAEEKLKLVDIKGNTDFDVVVDGKILRECLGKCLSKVEWYYINDVHYLVDDHLVQFFKSLTQ